ncbi:Aminomethyltransferase [Hartmannibacter diazotrophicus]|uniref:Aminomethyltransferase n=1 Tax=Hartmannibacter diazotrophicus TaxID=1482074 RepID=A0A2C9DDF0_9HYPH|nr:FAD-dependent oxidoreductase [Hartmannibacter diazotrophicus]SON58276.1 Aminomethyltransferase [Hartmannibacter diazotrophicus]
MSEAPLPDRAQIVVIGGGIIGCSTAYHLARDHKADVVLLEKGRLTSGTTWHAAGLIGQLRTSASITQVLKYSVELYERLETETGLASGWKQNGGLRLATTKDRWIELKRLATAARSFGLEMDLLTPTEARKRWPFMEISDLIGAAFLPTDGQATPSDITQSLARGARMHGARIFEGVTVTGFVIADGRVTAVETTGGPIVCESVVNCGGMWAKDIGRLAGVRVPLQAIEHQYLVSEPIEGLPRDLPTLRDPDRRTYFKEEVGGLIMGGYEADPIPFANGHIPDHFEFQLLEENWGHFEPHVVEAMARVPALKEVGVRQLVNGPESFTPDGNFILGRAPELGNFYLGCGFNAFGIASGGGAGWALAEWVMKGYAPLNLWSVDPTRFAGVHNDAFTKARTMEAYAKHYAVAYPNAEFESARPRLTSALYSRLRARGAVFGSKLGWERANWFASAGMLPEERPAQGRPASFDIVAAEHEACRNGVVMFDLSSMAKFEIWGPDAAARLEWLSANDIAQPPGSIVRTQMLNERGGIECDVTVTRIEGDAFYIVSATAARTHDATWISESLKGANATFQDVTELWGTIALMGPFAPAVMTAATWTDLALAPGQARTMTIAGAHARVLRLSVVGERGYEIHAPMDQLGTIYDALMEAGESFGIRPAGYRAFDSLRLEKAKRSWGADITSGDSPFEAGLGRCVKLYSSADFQGRAAAAAIASMPPRKRLCGFAIDSTEVYLTGRETILRNGRQVGYLSSGGWGHTVKTNIGFGYVSNGAGVTDAWLNEGKYEVVVAEILWPARLAMAPLYDPADNRLF